MFMRHAVILAKQGPALVEEVTLAEEPARRRGKPARLQGGRLGCVSGQLVDYSSTLLLLTFRLIALDLDGADVVLVPHLVP